MNLGCNCKFPLKNFLLMFGAGPPQKGWYFHPKYFSVSNGSVPAQICHAETALAKALA